MDAGSKAFRDYVSVMLTRYNLLAVNIDLFSAGGNGGYPIVSVVQILSITTGCSSAVRFSDHSAICQTVTAKRSRRISLRPVWMQLLCIC
jgi:hypothetical protein